MIFKIVTRADGGRLGRYLLSDKNEQVRVVELHSTVFSQPSAENLLSSLKDFDEFAKMTKGEKTIVHLVINPHDRDRMNPESWRHCIEKAEQAFGLSGQPRVVVEHLYKGKEHIHVAWSRVEIERAVCIPMSHSKRKAVAAAREVEQELGLHRVSGERTPERPKDQRSLNAEKHQNDRAAQSSSARSEIIARAWHQSQNGKEFKRQIEAAGYRLANGNRGVLVLDENLQPHSVARHIKDIKHQDVREKLSDLRNLPTVDNVRKPAKAILSPNRARHIVRDELKHQAANEQARVRQASAERTPEL